MSITTRGRVINRNTVIDCRFDSTDRGGGGADERVLIGGTVIEYWQGVWMWEYW